jgi:hypothetical protein
LTVRYDRVTYLLNDTPEHRKLIGRYIEVWEYPDGRIELRADGRALSCKQYDRLTEVDQGAVVEHKRLGHVLQVSQVIQAQRDNSRIGKAPSRSHLGVATKVQSRSQGQLVASFSRSSNLSESCVRTGFPGRWRNRLQFRFLDAANDRKPLLANNSHEIEP